MVKISAAFLERSIDNLCYATYMYKVELRLAGVFLLRELSKLERIALCFLLISLHFSATGEMK